MKLFADDNYQADMTDDDERKNCTDSTLTGFAVRYRAAIARHQRPMATGPTGDDWWRRLMLITCSEMHLMFIPLVVNHLWVAFSK